MRDLPVIERADAYQQFEDLAYLRALADQGLFDEELEDEISSESP